MAVPEVLDLKTVPAKRSMPNQNNCLKELYSPAFGKQEIHLFLYLKNNYLMEKLKQMIFIGIIRPLR